MKFSSLSYFHKFWSRYQLERDNELIDESGEYSYNEDIVERSEYSDKENIIER